MNFADTTFLIDLQRSHRNEHYQNALGWLENSPQAEVVISAIVWGEFTQGIENFDNPIVAKFRNEFEVMPITTEIAECFGRLNRDLKQAGRTIGANDTWIAATALVHEAPLLTRNVAHFTRVPGLRVINYS